MTEQPDVTTLAGIVSRQSLDLNMYAAFLLGTLSAALPAEYVTVRRKQSRFSRRGDGPVLEVAVHLGEQRFTLQRKDESAPPGASIAHEVGGIVLKTDRVEIADWAHRLAAALAELAQRNTAAAAALARITSLEV